jgi:hypothetical protein
MRACTRFDRLGAQVAGLGGLLSCAVRLDAAVE